MSVAVVEPARRSLALPGPWRLWGGSLVPELVMAYETWGERIPGRCAETLLLFTGLSPSAHASSSDEDPRPGWWEGLIGPGAALDTSRYRVVCPNAVGSCFGTIGPTTLDPLSGRPYGRDFPAVALEDTARAAGLLLRALGRPRARTVVGASMGGLIALLYALLHPGEVQSLVLISSAVASDPWAIAARTLQRQLLETSHPHGLRLARILGLLTYRSHAEWRLRFGRQQAEPPVGDDSRVEFQVNAYLEERAERFASIFAADSYRLLSAAMDRCDASDFGEGDIVRALTSLAGCRVCVIGVETDLLFPIGQQEELARACAAAGLEVVFHRLACLAGHDSFLVERDAFARAIRAFLTETREDS